MCGPDTMERVLAVAASGDRLRHYLLGSTPEVLDALINVPQTPVALGSRSRDGCRQGSPGPATSTVRSLFHSISATRPDIVWCALGAPKQELWMLRNADALRPALVLGVGAAFDFLAGTQPRAPVWMQHHGLEWAHRAATEPRRLLPRYLSTNSRFLGYVARDALSRRTRPRPGSRPAERCAFWSSTTATGRLTRAVRMPPSTMPSNCSASPGQPSTRR